jgi:hypothetical protein
LEFRVKGVGFLDLGAHASVRDVFVNPSDIGVEEIPGVIGFHLQG